MSGLEVVHVGEDSLFLSRFSQWFEDVLPGRSTYVVMAVPGSSALRFPLASSRVVPVISRGRSLVRLARIVRSADVVVVHSMGLFGASAAFAARSRARVMWSGFGGDYYGSSVSRDDGLLGPATARAKREMLGTPSLARRVDAWGREQITRSAARRADYFSAPLASDLEVFQRRFPGFSGRYVQLNYAILSDMDTGAAATGRDILVGNSASFANNHLEVFDALTRVDLGDRRVIVPLSYGESDAYRDLVVAAGRDAFGERFVPLTDYLPLADYIEIVASCGHVVMGHRRQQALGNIVAALCAGSEIVLDERNPVARALRDEGARIRTLDELGEAGFGGTRLDARDAAANRRVAERLWGDGVVHENLASFVRLVEADLRNGVAG